MTLPSVQYTAEFHSLEQERRTWLGDDGLVHILVPQVYDMPNGHSYIACWHYACGTNVLSAHVRGRKTSHVPTCILCIGARV